MDQDGLTFVLYDREAAFRREVSGLVSSADLLANGISTAEFTVDDDHVAVPDIVAEGAVCAVWFRGRERMRGLIKEKPGDGPDGTLTARIEGDLRKLWDWSGWQVPTAGPEGQTAAEYAVYSGKSEAVFKAALADNFERLGVPWTVAPDHGLGTPTRAEFRMHPLADKLMPALIADRLVVVLDYEEDGPGVVVDVREADTVAGTLTLASGVPDGYEFNLVAPTATRVIVGGRGEGTAREFVQIIDSAREAAWGDIIERFVDARNTEVGSDISIEGHEALADGAPRVGISTDLVETERFMLGKTYEVGDYVSVRLGPVDSTQQITGASITDDAQGGVVVTPHIGDADVSDDTDVALARVIAALARGFRDSGRR